MDISRLFRSSIGGKNKKPDRFKPADSGDNRDSARLNKLIARAARSWLIEFPNQKELPGKYAKLCWETMILARSKQGSPEDLLPDVCRMKGVDESEVIEALEALGRRIEETNIAFDSRRNTQSTLISRTKRLLERLR